MSSKVLVVDDEKMIRWGLTQALETAGYTTEQAETAKEALASFNNEIPDLVLLDYQLPDQSGLEVLRSIKQIAPRVPVVMITAHASLEGAVEAVKEGAYDYLSKPFEVDDILQCSRRALETSRLREEVSRRREAAKQESGAQNIVATSPAMKEVLRLIRRVAESEATTILLLGESGVGKGLIARALHYEGANWEQPFMNVTCTALPEALLESELFGHEKGSFTDAKFQKKGLFELANGGTLFLDEIGDLPMPLQGKLLRVLEDKTFRRVGGTRDIKVSVRIVAATNKRLEKEVEAERFRRDLLFRLKVIPIEIPPLRERKEDLAPLADGFVRTFNLEFKKNVLGFHSEAKLAMERYPWPGNVRELRNAVERAVLLTEGQKITLQDLPSELRAAVSAVHCAGEQDGFNLPAEGVVLDEVEKKLVIQALEKSRGNRTRAAKLLGLNRDQIRYRIEKFGLEDAFNRR